MSTASEFKDFIARGNVVDLAVGVVIGGAFGKIVSSFVDGVVMPVVGIFTGGVDFSAMKYVISAGDPAKKIAENAIAYGAFINTIIQFVIVALVIFMVVKAVNKMSPPKVEAPAGPTPTESLLAEIRDSLKK